MGTIKGHSSRIRLGLATAENSSIWASAPDPLINSISMDTSVDIDRVYVVGSRDAIDIIEGVQEITGSIERNLYSNNASNQIVYENDTTAHDLLAATGMFGENLSHVKILINTTDRNAATYNLVIYGAKLHSYSTSISAEDIVTESVDFDATNISTN